MFKFLIRLFLALLLIGAITAGGVCYLIMGPALDIESPQKLIIERSDDINSVTKKLEQGFGLKHPKVFLLIANKMNVGNVLRPGRFEIEPEMSNRAIAVLLRKGGTLTVDVVIRGTQDIRNMPAFLGEKLEPDEGDFYALLNSDEHLSQFGFSSKTVAAMFIPNTYNMFWFANAEDVLLRMHSEYQKFWNEKRLKQASDIGLTPIEVSILASILDKETNKVDEMPRIAGVYLNRLRNNWKLQADPTVKFAMDSMSLKRILKGHTLIEHPYNTYFVEGLPPGPICIPSLQAIKAVLEPEEHNYMFFCARPDMSGYHNFAVTLDQHNLNAANYHKFLNRLERENRK